MLENSTTYKLIKNPYCKDCKKIKDSEHTVRLILNKYYKFCNKCNKQTENIINDKEKKKNNLDMLL
jgi:Zn finger protein HypA/HybF involved in hydrogenase expression